MCDFLDTATVCPDEGKRHKMIGHKFEIRIVVYRDGDELKAFPSIAKVGGRDAWECGCIHTKIMSVEPGGALGD